MSCRAPNVAVIGGGPAGSAAAIELSRHGVSVTLLERSRYDDRRVGDTLAPAAAPHLARLGVQDEIRSLEGVEARGTVSLWGSFTPVDTDHLFNPYGCGRHIDRNVFDRALADAARRNGATLLLGTRALGCVRNRERWTITARIGSRVRELQSRWLIDASGRSRCFIRNASRPIYDDRLVAVIARLARDVDDDRLAVEALPTGWCYLSPLPGKRAVVAFLTDGDLLQRSEAPRVLERHLGESQLVSSLLPRNTRLVDTWQCAAGLSWTQVVAGPGWLAAGDAAHAHDPLSGKGIWKALQSGALAARAVVAASRGDRDAFDRYQAFVDAEIRTDSSERARVYADVARWRDQPFWRRRVFGGLPNYAT